MKLLEKIINQETYMVNWDEVAKIPEFGVLKKTEQNPKWHSEGNVWNHIVNVVNEMYKLVPYNESDKIFSDIRHQRRLVMVAAALFHDIGKGATTNGQTKRVHGLLHVMHLLVNKSHVDCYGMKIFLLEKKYALWLETI